MRKFGAPESCIRAYQHWCVLLRPVQITLGSLVLVASEPVTAFSELSPASFAELKIVTNDLETSLKNAFSYDKLNYLMLMMVDPDVHFHIIPRYAGAKYFAENKFVDSSWPDPPDLAQFNQTDETINKLIVDCLCENWNA